MLLTAIAYLGGVLTILSPCILPVLPFVFARADRPFARGGLPMLVGLALSFAGVATLASVAGGWAVDANRYGRVAAMALLGLFGLALLLPGLGERLGRPLARAGGRLAEAADRERRSPVATILWSLLLGVGTGLLWAPCAGPILGLILTGAALRGASLDSSLLLLAYALGAATSLALALLVGGRMVAVMKRALGPGEWLRRGLGAAVLAGVAVAALGLDTGLLARASLAGTAGLEQRLLHSLLDYRQPAMMAGNGAQDGAGATMMMQAKPAQTAGDDALPVEGALPPLDGAVTWLNSPPLTAAALRGKVVLVDFWTYSCINCLRALPYVRAWAAKYRDAGLVVIGVHAPEFAFEKDLGNVRSAVASLGIDYPVAVDNDYAIWRAFGNQYWPAHYFVDARGHIRHHHFGEGDYAGAERVIRSLLAEAGRASLPAAPVAVSASGAEAAPDLAAVGSPETYVGYGRGERFVSPGGSVADARHLYEPGMPRLNEWGLVGDWTVGSEHATLDAAGGGGVYRFHARDLHLVLGPRPGGAPVRFRVTIDGAPPGDSHGADSDADGRGSVTGERLYQLVRQSGPVADRTFEIRFLDPGVEVYAFTFG